MRICKLGEEVLREKCTPLAESEINDDFRKLCEEMFETMDQADGVGLAAPQVGIAKRFFVVTADDGVRRVFVNPEIIKTSSEIVPYEEGCLSLPGIYEEIKRPAAVTITALDQNGKRFTLDAEGLLARVVQHENDHLDGILYIDRGDPDFKEEVTDQFKRRAERAAKKAAEKAAKKASLEAKLAAKAAKKAAKNI